MLRQLDPGPKGKDRALVVRPAQRHFGHQGSLRDRQRIRQRGQDTNLATLEGLDSKAFSTNWITGSTAEEQLGGTEGGALNHDHVRTLGRNNVVATIPGVEEGIILAI